MLGIFDQSILRNIVTLAYIFKIRTCTFTRICGVFKQLKVSKIENNKLKLKVNFFLV